MIGPGYARWLHDGTRERAGLFTVPDTMTYIVPVEEPDPFIEELLRAMTEAITDDFSPTTRLGCFR